MTRHKERRERLKAEGRCAVCGSADVVSGGTLCKKCREKQHENSRRMRERKKERGECAFCRNPAVHGKVLCEACAEKNRQAYFRRKAAAQ